MRRLSSPEIVGRERELAALEAALGRAAGGEPSVILLAGEAGVGKSRLLRELEGRARGAGALVLRGDCVPLAAGELPYGPILMALRELDPADRAELLETLPEGASAELGRLLPGLAVGEAGGAAGGDDRFGRARLYELMLRALRGLSERRVVVLALEDLHWADRSTLDFVSFLTHNVSRERIALVGTYRSDELRPRHPLRLALGELIRRDPVERLELARLSRPELERQLAAILRHPPPPALAEEIFARSAGNPFFAEELVAAQADGAEVALPESLRDALLARIETLEEDTQAVLRLIAVAGRPVGPDLLTVAAGTDVGLPGALRGAISAHVLVQDPAEHTVAFRHDLVREAVYADLLPTERRSLHRAVAEALASEDEQWVQAELAHHWHAAGDVEAALLPSINAGLSALNVYAFAEARDHLERALELWSAVTHPPEDLPLDRIALLGHAADAARLSGDHERAGELCREALATLAGSGDRVRLASFHERLGRYQFWDDEAALASYEEALRLLPDDRTADRARVLAAEGQALMGMGRWEEARARCAPALELARAAGAAAEEVSAHMTLGLALAFLGDPAAGEAELRRARAMAERSGRAEDQVRLRLHLAEVLRLRGEVAEALAVTLEGVAVAERLGLGARFGRSLSVNAAEDLLRLGRWEEAARRLDEMGSVELSAPAELLRETLAGQLAVMRGEAETASEHLQRATALIEAGAPPEYLPAVHGALAELALWHDRPELAAEHVAAGLAALGDLEDPLNAPVLYSLGARAHADAADAARVVGDRDAVEGARREAESLLTRLHALVARRFGYAPPPEAQAHRALCAGELSRAAGQPDPDAWARAAEAWVGLGQPYPAAYARWRQAEASLLCGGERTVAAKALRSAAEAAERLGAEPLRRHVEGLGRRARLELAAAAPAPSESESGGRLGELGITRRELEVLRLVAEGQTNRQIAERLFISRKTAGAHVSHILEKLNARNRVEAAGIAQRLGLEAEP